MNDIDQFTVPGSSTSWIFKFFAPVLRFLVSEMFGHYARRSWTKTRTPAMTINKGMRDSKIQDSEDVDVLRSPTSSVYFKALLEIKKTF